MANNELPELVDFELLKSLFEAERKALIRVNAFSEEDEFVRTIENAVVVLECLERIQVPLTDCFAEYPSLLRLFDKDFSSYREFTHRDNILETCFLDNCLFPESDDWFFVGQESGVLESDLIEDIIKRFREWSIDKVQKHKKTQVKIQEGISHNLRPKDLECQCHGCVAEFRNQLREQIFNESIELVKIAEAQIKETIERVQNPGISKTNQIYRDLQKKLDNKFFSARFRLRRSSLNRLENQVKERVKRSLTYPSALAKQQIGILKPFFIDHLRSQGLRPDLIGEEEFERWFSQLSTNIWRGENYLDNEFNKLVKSVLTLKRKDISANILKEYLGEFWIHSDARKLNRKIIYHMGPTNSGKTYSAIQMLARASSGCYLAPLRLLAGELYDTLNEMGVVTTLLTGEEVIETEGATHFSSTIEMARFHQEFESCVIDEIQMITDPQRGWAWTRALVNIYAPEVHVCGDPSAFDLVQKIVDLCGDSLEVVNYDRLCGLEVEDHHLTIGQLEKWDALIVFSRKNALKYKSELERLDFKVSIVYGRLGPEVRREQARRFDKGETDIMVSTDAIAMGMNLPIKRIVFSTLTKHINATAYPISKSEIKQIAGRAGRYKRFPIGHISCLEKVEEGIGQINEAMSCVLDQKLKCMVGPDLDIFRQVNSALGINALPELKLSEFLRLFNTMTFLKPFYCVDLKEMIEITEMVEDADYNNILSDSEIFGFSCAPVNLGLLEHVQYFIWILNHYVRKDPIRNEPIDFLSNNIDYLETSIKCVELFQWLSRHFDGKNFDYSELELLENKGRAIDKLNDLLSEKIVRTCASCGVNLEEASKFAICELCFKERRFRRRPGRGRRIQTSGESSKNSHRQSKRGKKSGGRRAGGKRGTRKKSKGKG